MEKKDVDRILARIFENKKYLYYATIYDKFNSVITTHDKKDGRDNGNKNYYVIYKNDSTNKYYIPYDNIGHIVVDCQYQGGLV